MADNQVAVSETVKADPEALYDLVADLAQMGKLEPGGDRREVDRRSERAGARREVPRQQPRRLAPLVDDVSRSRLPIAGSGSPSMSPSVRYQSLIGPTNSRPAATGTTVTEEWHDRRPGWMDAFVQVLVMGVPDRASHNRGNMAATLKALKDAAENGAT